MARVARHVYVKGRVQGVAFRWYAQERANQLGVSGWIRNLDDGRVEVWVEGEQDSVEQMLAWLRRGPPSARVEGLEVSEREPENLPAFEVRRSALR